MHNVMSGGNVPHHITTIAVPFILNFSVNCYLVRLNDGFVLIDTAKSGQRRRVTQALAGAGCHPGQLKLIVLTHGDFDHCGNAAYLRQTFNAPVALHPNDRGMVEHGDMFANRNQPKIVMRALTGALFRLPPADRFQPDVALADGDTLAAYGWDAQIVHLPGHSSGNCGILTAEGDLFCGDLLANTNKPALWTIMDDVTTAQASVAKLKRLPIRTVYPGHGQPFPMQAFWQHNAADTG